MDTPHGSSTSLRVLLAAIVGMCIACSHDNSGPSGPSGPTFSSPQPIAIGHMIGDSVFAPGDSSAGGQGQKVANIPCDTLPPIQHIHAHLTLIADGRQVAIPLGVGVVNPFIIQNFVIAAGCYYWIHTHDATGIIHVEAPVTTQFRLGDFFAIWGEPLSRDNVAGFSGTVTAYVDSTRYDGDLDTLGFQSHQQITLIVGTVPNQIPLYQFPSAY